MVGSTAVAVFSGWWVQGLGFKGLGFRGSGFRVMVFF